MTTAMMIKMMKMMMTHDGSDNDIKNDNDADRNLWLMVMVISMNLSTLISL